MLFPKMCLRWDLHALACIPCKYHAMEHGNICTYCIICIPTGDQVAFSHHLKMPYWIFSVIILPLERTISVLKSESKDFNIDEL